MEIKSLLLSLWVLLTLVGADDTLQRNAKYLSNHNFKDIQQLNKFNGDVTESVMSGYFKSSGWGQINGEVGVNGIDGLFIKKDKKGGIKDVMFVESKYNKSQLGYIDKKTPNLKSRQMSKRALEKQVDNLIVDTKKKMSKAVTLKDRARLKQQLSDYKVIKNKIQVDAYRARLFKMKPVGDSKFKITIDALEQKGHRNITKKTLAGIKKYKANNVIIDMKKKYKTGSYEAKLQAKIKSSIKSTKGSHKIKKAYNSSKKTSKILKAAVPMVFIKKGKKVLAFMDASVLKKASKYKSLKFLKNIKGGDVVMMALEGGAAVYTVLHGGMTYKKVSSLLFDTGKTLAGEGFSKGIALLTPPPATLIVIATIAGEILIDYAIDKYVELDKRGYVGLEDMLWDVPDEIKDKITVLNLEDIKRETVFDFSDIDRETILDGEQVGETILDNDNIEKETILDI